ncbi:hypothetical protein ACFQX7_24130 [Luedemannella flava]
MIFISVAVVIVILMYGYGLLRSSAGAVSVKAGDCLPATAVAEGASAGELDAVDCAGTGAAYQIVALMRDRSKSAQHETLCELLHPTSDGAIWVGRLGTGTALCLHEL